MTGDVDVYAISARSTLSATSLLRLDPSLPE